MPNLEASTMTKLSSHAARVLAALVLLLGLHATTLANDFDDATAAYDRGDYETALRLMKPLAEQGVVGAQVILGTMYFDGQSVPQDYAEAAKWYRLAAEQGDALAQYGLGFLYILGQDVPQDYAEAAKWFRKAAEQGDASGQNGLGFLCFRGQGLPQDYVQAHMWFDLSAAQGNEEAARNRTVAASKMTTSQLEEAQRLAHDWLAKHQP